MAYLKNLKLRQFSIFNEFEYNFHKRLNFILGFNGVGKSSVFHGIMIGLGYKVEDIRERNVNLSTDSVITSFIHKPSEEAFIELTVCNGPKEKVVVAVELRSSGGISYRFKINKGLWQHSDRSAIRNLFRRHFPDCFKRIFISEDSEQAMRREFRDSLSKMNPPEDWSTTSYVDHIVGYWRESVSGSFILDAPDLFSSEEDEENEVSIQKFQSLAEAFPNKQFTLTMFDLSLEANESKYKILRNPAGKIMKLSLNIVQL